MAAAYPVVGELALSQSPYPGLRPFQPDDSDYFFGREQQVAEVVTRLRANRFVAVLGGSGSGKSSLVLAGAIPRLRSLAIQEAGDLWVPVISTPGTNLPAHVTPISRLARKFCEELVVSANPADRIAECTDLLRMRNGLGLMVERFSKELRNPSDLKLSGPDIQVNFLFLIDQFEELFHPSNLEGAVAADCTHLANRIIEQFKSRHRQVCVALTMRSEHLNDCPRYQDLPDAINASGYLVKRLIGDDLKKAIVEPAQRFLTRRRAEVVSARRRQRSASTHSADAAIPEEIPFAPTVLARLLSDSESVFNQQDHADHLPLLQHSLFWIWRAACERCKDLAAPDEISFEDLCNAVVPDVVPRNGCALNDSDNVLENCLKNHCDAIFSGHPSEAGSWERAFRSLAFKDPNSGNYTQQRVSMKELAECMNLSQPDRLALYQSLAPWLSPHAYLHWDESSHSVKVAHETLIRRWESFRKWTDDEDARYQTYVRLLEDCLRWVNGGGESEDLSTGIALRRYEDASMLSTLRDKNCARRLERLLAKDRDWDRLGRVTADALRFLEQSHEQHARQILTRERAEQSRRDAEVARARAAEAEATVAETKARLAEADAKNRAQRERSARQRLQILLAVFLLISVALGLAYQYSLSTVLASDHATNVSYRILAETNLRLSNSTYGLTEQQSPLRNALTGAHLFIEERSTAMAITDASDSWYLPVSEAVTWLKRSLHLAEERHIAGLRSVLSNAVWSVPASGAFNEGTSVRCDSVSPIDYFPNSAREYRFFRLPSSQSQGLIVLDSWRSVFAGRDTNIGERTACQVERHLLTAPATEQQVGIGIAGDLSHLALVFRDYLQLYPIRWNRALIEAQPGPTVVRPFDLESFNVNHAFSLPVATRSFARDLKFNRNTIRIFDFDPSPFAEASQGHRLEPLDENALCDQIAQQYWRNRNDAAWEGELNVDGKQQHTYCLHVSRVPAQYSSDPNFVATLYRIDASATNEHELALRLIEQAPLGADLPTEFRLDHDEGWLAFRVGTEKWLAIPFGLETFIDLALEVFDPRDIKVNEGERYKRVYDEVLDPGQRALTAEQLQIRLRQARSAAGSTLSR